MKEFKLLPAGSLPQVEDSFEGFENGYHPFSYYVLGGVDISGDHTRLDAKVMYDDDADINSGAHDGSCDPRVSKFDICEQSGVEAFENLQEDIENEKK